VLAGPLRVGFALASHVGWWIVAGCGLVVLVVGLITTGPWAQGTADRVAAQLRPGPAASEAEPARN
jgi:hypothetical protein